jgi:hypothetical protein
MSSVDNPRRNARKRNPPATRRRALELLACAQETDMPETFVN